MQRAIHWQPLATYIFTCQSGQATFVTLRIAPPDEPAYPSLYTAEFHHN